MDRNQVTGLILIFLIIVGYSWWMSPSEEEQKALEMKRDSARRAQQNELREDSLAQLRRESQNTFKKDSLLQDSLNTDTAVKKTHTKNLGSFSQASEGEDKVYTIENQNMIVKFSNKGAYPIYAELKDFKSYDGSPLYLFKGKDNQFELLFNADNVGISTLDLYFEPVQNQTEFNASESGKAIQFRAYAGNNRYIEFKYSLEPESHLLDFSISMHGMDDIIPRNNPYANLNWESKARRHEKGTDWENQNTTVYYKYFEDEVDYLTETSDEKDELLKTRVRWIAYKGHFFTSALIAEGAFQSAQVEYTKDEAQEVYLKKFSSSIDAEYDQMIGKPMKMAYYFGPNDYDLLSDVKLKEDDELNLKRILPLGWAVFRWINQFIVIPLFNFLGSFISNYGIIILIMTIIIKMVLFPLTYKSYVSSAKMRVLKPQIDEINKKIPKDKAMERQQATMGLYKKAGVNPMGGCLPMLIQFPFLIAMFRFFPASIELRQKSFLWADDLSTYDSIWTFPGGFEIPFYGDHISLFTLLMAGALMLSTLLNQNQMSGGSSQMPGMKMMMYIMPLMMLFWFNNYSAGLSYYYFLSNVITIGQTLIIRRMIDEDKLLRKLNENKKKPKKRSKFQERLEKMAKEKERMNKNRKK
jgi:YidC/Oxa1 family membrane protein insertase